MLQADWNIAQVRDNVQHECKLKLTTPMHATMQAQGRQEAQGQKGPGNRRALTMKRGGGRAPLSLQLPTCVRGGLTQREDTPAATLTKKHAKLEPCTAHDCGGRGGGGGGGESPRGAENSIAERPMALASTEWPHGSNEKGPDRTASLLNAFQSTLHGRDLHHRTP